MTIERKNQANSMFARSGNRRKLTFDGYEIYGDEGAMGMRRFLLRSHDGFAATSVCSMCWTARWM